MLLEILGEVPDAPPAAGDELSESHRRKRTKK